MASLYVDRKGVELRLDGQVLAFYENDERTGTVPLAPLDRIYLRGDVKLHSGLLSKLGALGIGVIIISGRKATVNLMMAKPHNDAARRVAQYKLSLDPEFILAFSKAIVELKLKEQQLLLEDLKESRPMFRYELTVRIKQIKDAIQTINRQTSIASLRGVEGRAATAYFAGLKVYLPESLQFSSRNRRPPKDPVNAVLSLGYTLLHSETVIALYCAGFDPFIGFYHQLDFGRESLASDMVETLRTDYDRFVLELFRTKKLRKEDFSVTTDGCFMNKSARSRYYIEFEQCAEIARKKLSQHIRDLHETILRYQNNESMAKKE